MTLHRALRRTAGLVFLLVSWVLAGACQRHGVGGFLLCNSSSSTSCTSRRGERTPISTAHTANIPPDAALADHCGACGAGAVPARSGS